MKNRLLLLLLMALLTPWTAFGQSEFTFGDDATSTSRADSPYGGLFGFEYHVYLYDAADVDFSGTVTSVSFKSSTSSVANGTANYTLYMKDVPSTTTLSLSTTFAEFTAGLTPVFSSTSMPALAEGWNATTLTNTFEHQSGNSILVMARAEGCSLSGGCSKYVYYEEKSRHAWHKKADNTDPGPNVSGNNLNASAVSIKFTYTPSGDICEAPTNLHFTDITTHSAFASWGGGSQNFGFEYKKASETTWNVVCEYNCGYNYSMVGLKPDTEYQFRVRSYCSDTDSYSEWVTGSFTTAYVIYDIPFEETFSTTSIPSSWAKYTGLLSDVMDGAALTSTTYGWGFGNYNDVFDLHTRLNIYGTNCKYWLVTPRVALSDDCLLSFDLAYTAYSGSMINPEQTGTDDKFVVLVTTDNGETWQIMRQWDNAGSPYVLKDLTPEGKTIELDLSDYTDQTVRVAFYGESTQSNADNNLHIDNVSIDYLPNCHKPTDLYVSGITYNSVVLSWYAFGGQNHWELAYKTDDDPYYRWFVEPTENPYVLTGQGLHPLQPDTHYTVKIRAMCGDGYSSWSDEIEFTTDVACEPPTNFEVSDLTYNNANVTWEGVVDYFYADWKAEDEDEWHPFNFGNSIGGGVDFNNTLEPNTTYYVRAKTICPEGGTSHYSTVSFTTLDACELPTNIHPRNLQHDYAYFEWEPINQSYDVEYKLASSTEWIPEYQHIGSGAGLFYLQPATTYDLRVKRHCPNGYDTPWVETSFTTPCAPITSFPWSENFNSYSAGNFTEPCWINEHITGSGTQVFKIHTSTMGDNSTPKLQLPDMYSGTMTKLVLPFMDLPDDEYQFVLDVYRNNSYNTYTTEGIRVFASTNGEIEGATELAFIPRVYSVASGEIPAESAEGWYTYDMPIGMSGYCYIILCGESKYGAATYMDNFVVEPIPPCHLPTHITVTDVMSDGFEVNYTPGSSAQDIWLFAWSTENVEPTTYIGSTTNPSTYSTYGLQPETHYYLWVGIECEDDMSYHWARPVEFTTLEACPSPTNVTITDITTTEATVNWVNESDTWISLYRADYDETYDFETNTLQGWTNEGDATWEVGTGDHSTSTGAHSGNYNAKITHTTDGNETWLVSPLMDLTGMDVVHVDFWYINRSWSGDVDGLGVYYRIDGGEWHEAWTSDQAHETWTEKRVEVYDYAANYQIGFKMTDLYGYGVGLDDIRIAGEKFAGNYSVYYPNQSYSLTNLQPNTTYEFYMATDCGDISSRPTDWISFTTEEETTVTQTITLAEGLNWFSTSVEITLDDLKAALVAALPGNSSITIKSQNNGQTTWNGRLWVGQLRTMDVAKMYMINVPNSCEITLEGMPIVPAEHPITINYGPNWIGFPFNENMSIANAFANFATPGDIVKSNGGGQATWNGRLWVGQLKNLVPGNGYIYQSAATGTKTFTYPTSKSKK